MIASQFAPDSSIPERTTQISSVASYGSTFHAKQSVNVRSGRGEQHPIVTTLQRGQEVDVGPVDEAGWAVVFGESADTLGYVLRRLLTYGTLPPVEVETWSWYRDPDFAGDGAVIWTGVIRNNTAEYVRSVRVEFTSFDASGNVMDTDWSYATGLQPGGTASVKGYATYFGNEDKASLVVKE